VRWIVVELRRRIAMADRYLGCVRVESLGFRTDLAIRRLGGSAITAREDYVVIKTPTNPGYWWGNFILLRRPIPGGRAQALRAAFEGEFPGARHMTFGIDGTQGEIGDRSTTDALGLSADVSAVLTAARLREPERRSTVAVHRPLHRADDWAQAALLRRACDDRPDTPEHRLFQRRELAEARDVCERGHGSWFGAFIEGRLVSSLGLIRTDPTTARYQDVATHPDYRRQGLAGQLIYQSSRYGADQLGVRRLVIVADPDYHAIDIYCRLGFSVGEHQVQLAWSAPDA
jgi:GNAT superfamily N-acetyltransferase